MLLGGATGIFKLYMGMNHSRGSKWLSRGWYGLKCPQALNFYVVYINRQALNNNITNIILCIEMLHTFYVRMCKYQLAWSLHYALYVSTMFWYVIWSMKLYTFIVYVLRKWNKSSYKINVSVLNNATSLWQLHHIIANVYTYVHTCVTPLGLHCDVIIVAFG